jgi:hypothetical protein
MFARLTTIRMKGDRQEEFVKTYEERVIQPDCRRAIVPMSGVAIIKNRLKSSPGLFFQRRPSAKDTMSVSKTKRMYLRSSCWCVHLCQRVLSSTMQKGE